MESRNLCLVGNLLEASNDYVVIDYVVELLYVTFSHVDRLIVMAVAVEPLTLQVDEPTITKPLLVVVLLAPRSTAVCSSSS